ncbi:MAG: ribonuclease J [Alphaproteobacteria bacterium]|nr:ribonuclease J [Alphaproteobacteria bacterium]
MVTHLPTKNDLWFLPLGGAGEIGMNLNLFGHDSQWLMVDLGITFGDRLGIEIISPDPTFILPYQKNLKGLVLTHAHEDHVGALPYLWPYLRCPVYATPFTAAIVRQKIADKPWRKELQLIEVPLSGKIDIGVFNIEFITLTHSIPEPNALAIKTPLGTIVHTGDWKIDPMPLIGDVTNESRLMELGKEGVLAMVCDSTNVFTEGVSGSEQAVRDELIKQIAKYPNDRVTIACFASNVARIETAALAAKHHGRKVALIGRSLHRMVQAAEYAGYLKNVPAFISDEEAMKLPPEKVLFIMTGSQGEPRSALARIAANQHPVVRMDSDDVVFFSSRIIPGNEKGIGLLQNNLVKGGAQVITANEEDIHVSGHPARDELKKMYKWVRPRIAIPVHGEARHLLEHARLAKSQGIKEVVIPENGSLIQIEASHSRIIDNVQSGRWALDGNRMIPVISPVLKDRNKISLQGIIVASLMADKFGQLLKDPSFTILGVTEPGKETEMLTNDLLRVISNTLLSDFKNNEARLEALRLIIRQTVNQRFGKKPIVEVHLVMGKN